MTTARTLQPADEIAQYRVVGPLGAGGMGEVYLAQDRTLERNVALKVLPPELVKNEDRVRRFVQEAKSASSLNHPNIVTIYEIGQEPVRSASGSDTGSVQYISMELISGKTLGAKIHEEKTDLRTLLGYLAQAAEGIAKAHAAGIVHRDLKPGNIMVSDDGFAKVLDFGLAKLTEKRSAESVSATAMTEVADRTSEGTVLGTVAYMSPEQVQGKPLDHRSDIFSFGCILYEAATQRRPFLADSNVETMHKILNEKPAAIENFNPAAPAELRRLIRRCLAKAPDQRLQSMKDLAIELREIVDEYDALSASVTSASTGSGAALAIPARKSRAVPIVVGAILVAVVGLGYGLWSSRRHGAEVAPFQHMRASTQTSRGDVNFSALSPDGRYIAYVAGNAGSTTLRVRQVATGSDVEVLPVQNAIFESPSFSPDGNYLYFLKRRPDQPLYRSLVRVPSLGGAEEEKAFDVDSRVTFSPDAKRVCFLRGIPQERRTAIVVRDLENGAERELASVYQPEDIIGASPSWSPDGKRIAIFAFLPPPKTRSTLVMLDSESGRREDFLVEDSARLLGLAWMPDGRGLVASGTIVSDGMSNQVYVVSYPGGKITRVTNDFDSYSEVSASTGGDGAIATLRASAITNLFVASLDGTVRKLTNATSPERSPLSLAVAGDRVVFQAVQERHMGIGQVPIDGGEEKWMSGGPGHVAALTVRGNIAFFQRYDDDLQLHVWRMNLDGTGLKQLTTGEGEQLLDVTRDGQLISFATSDSSRSVFVQSVGGGKPVPIAATGVDFGPFLRDGKTVLIADLTMGASGLIEAVVREFPVTGGAEIVHYVQPPQVQDPKEAEGNTFTYLNRDDPARNIYRFKSESEQATQVTHFTDGRLTGHEWSPDLQHLAVVRRDADGENVWVTDAKGGSAKQVTRFDGEDVFDLAWTLDSRRVIVRAGTQSRDVVMISNFR